MEELTDITVGRRQRGKTERGKIQPLGIISWRAAVDCSSHLGSIQLLGQNQHADHLRLTSNKGNQKIKPRENHCSNSVFIFN